MWKKINNTREDDSYYSVFRKCSEGNSMEALRVIFPDGEADELNMVLFSTSGVHGSYITIEDAEEHLISPSEETSGDVTFLVLHPRIVSMLYGNCTPENQGDIDYLKRLRSSSHAQLSMIGMNPE